VNVISFPHVVLKAKSFIELVVLQAMIDHELEQDACHARRLILFVNGFL
jgi:hypothetical protein